MKHLAILVDGDVLFCGSVDEFVLQQGEAVEHGEGMLALRAIYPLGEKKA